MTYVYVVFYMNDFHDYYIHKICKTKESAEACIETNGESKGRYWVEKRKLED